MSKVHYFRFYTLKQEDATITELQNGGTTEGNSGTECQNTIGFYFRIYANERKGFEGLP